LWRFICAAASDTEHSEGNLGSGFTGHDFSIGLIESGSIDTKGIPTDGKAIPRMKDEIWISTMLGSFYPWDCLAIRGTDSFAHMR
jgi:hypothetical protein